MWSKIGLLALLALTWTVSPAWAVDTQKAAYNEQALQSAAVATGNGTSIAVDRYSSLGLDVTIAGTATITVEGSVEGTNAYSLTCMNTATGGSSPVITASGLYQCNVAGLKAVRARISAWTSGAVTVFGRASTAIMGSATGGSGIASAGAPTFVEGGGGAFSFDLIGNLRVTQGTLTSGENQGTSQATSWVAVRPQPFITYTATNAWTPPATPTDLLTITGSASKTVKVWSIRLTTTNTAAGSQEFFLIKRSAVDTGGTPVAGTVFPLDSASAAGTATVNHYTANPAALGTAVGTVNRVRISSPAAVPASFAGVDIDAGYELLEPMRNGLYVQPITLRGVAEQLAVNFNGAALVAGQTHVYTIIWSEE